MENHTKIDEGENLVICAYCNRIIKGNIATSKGKRGKVSTDTHISHGICPQCLMVYFPKEYLMLQEKEEIIEKESYKEGLVDFYGHAVG